MHLLTISLLDPLIWAFAVAAVMLSYRLPKWSWIRFLVIVLVFPYIIDVFDLQARLLQKLEPSKHDLTRIDYVWFPSLLGAIGCLVFTLIREERIKKNQQRPQPQET